MATEVTIIEADNQVVMFLDRKIIFNQSWDGEASRNVKVDITNHLVAGATNFLVIVGLNWGGPYKFAVSVKHKGQELGPFQAKGTPAVPKDGWGVPWSQSVQIHPL